MAGNFWNIVAQSLPNVGYLVVGFFVLVLFVLAGLVIFLKYREKFTSNAKAWLFSVNEDGNILSSKVIYGKIDYENRSKEIKFKKIEETLSIEKVAPIKINKDDFYIVAQFMDGTYKVVNPSVVKDADGKAYLDLDDEQLDYKRWYAAIVPMIYEMTHKDQMAKATKMALWITLGSIAAGLLIFGFAVWFSTKLVTVSMGQGYSTLTQINSMLGAALQNITVVP